MVEVMNWKQMATLWLGVVLILAVIICPPFLDGQSLYHTVFRHHWYISKTLLAAEFFGILCLTALGYLSSCSRAPRGAFTLYSVTVTAFAALPVVAALRPHLPHQSTGTATPQYSALANSDLVKFTPEYTGLQISDNVIRATIYNPTEHTISAITMDVTFQDLDGKPLEHRRYLLPRSYGSTGAPLSDSYYEAPFLQGNGFYENYTGKIISAQIEN